MIPKIVKIYFSNKKENILLKFLEDNSYFISPNIFYLNEIKIGPFKKKVELSLQICDFRFNYISLDNVEKTNISSDSNPNQFYYKIVFKDKLKIESDIKISVDGAGLNFYVWTNLWYSSYSCIKEFLEFSKMNMVKIKKIFFNFF